MASTEIYVRMKGNKKWMLLGEVPNASRGAFKLWMELEKKYLPSYDNEITSRSDAVLGGPRYHSRFVYGDNDARMEVWHLYTREDIPDDEADVLLSTLDKARVNGDRIPQFIKHLRSVGERFDTNHIEQAELLEQFYADYKDRISAIAWNQTSICSARDIFGSNMSAPLREFFDWEITQTPQDS